VDVKGTPAIAEVEYYFRLRFDKAIYSLALISMFSNPDQEILALSNHAAYICRHGGTDALTVVEVKAITAVVSMVPDYEVTVDGSIIIPENRYSLMEAPLIRLVTLCGTVEDETDGIDNDNDFVD
jgi:hypothetical protein